MISRETILNDLAPFADLGTEAPAAAENGSTLVVRLVRNGERMQLSFTASNTIIQKMGNQERKFQGIQGLLAGPAFADLGRWSDMQKISLSDRISQEDIPVTGKLVGEGIKGGVDIFDNILAPAIKPRTSIVLLNGPSGIGKTTFIRKLAYQRARDYRRKQRPLVLHVESRGRMLQNITDLMAFSLQTLRVTVTYDQIPVLIRNGLIVLAIDGFDELGDPNGYGLAWAQVNELVASVRGEGTLILAGRETFINRDQMTTALTAVDSSQDKLELFELNPLAPEDAKAWLRAAGWSEELLGSDVTYPLFEDGSYALRPFFVSVLANLNIASRIETGAVDDLLGFLIEVMIEREANKFGKDVQAVTSLAVLRNFVLNLMEEVARDLAENQTDAISEDTLAWIAEIVAIDIVGQDLVGILKNRANVVAFLTSDERRGYRRFSHEQFQNFFLSRVTLVTIRRGETPKFIRRNIIGQHFLENFCAVARHASDQELTEFAIESIRQINTLGNGDRSRQNLAALLLALYSVSHPPEDLIIENVDIDECYVSETVSPIRVKNVVIKQIIARQADFRAIKFEDCILGSLTADEGTVPAASLPRPTIVNLPENSLTAPEEIEKWLSRQYAERKISELSKQFEPTQEILSKFGLFDLLFRVSRYRPFWIKDNEDRSARRILDDPNWDTLKKLLMKYDLLIVRNDVPSSGRPAFFYHIKNRNSFRSLDNIPDSIRPFIIEILCLSLEIQSKN